MDDPNDIMNKNVDHFEDIFHQFGDDGDEDNDDFIDFENLYTRIGYDNEEDDPNVLGFGNEDNPFKELPRATTVQNETEHLSQKLSQLSADDPQENKQEPLATSETSISTTRKRPSLTPTSQEAPSSESTTKKLKTFTSEEEKISFDSMAHYMSTTDGRFDAIVRPYIRQQLRSVNIEDLRQCANLLHRLKCLELDKLLWNKYLQAGTGELIKEEHIRSVLTVTTNKLSVHRYWPLDLKLRMIKRGQTTAQDPKYIEHDSCVDYVQRVLAKFDQQTEFYQAELQTLRQRLHQVMSQELEHQIKYFVRQNGTSLYRIYIDQSIAAIEYDYKDQLIQGEFYQQRPNSYQRTTFNELFELKRSDEQSKLDIAILKQRLLYKQLPRSFDVLRIPTTLKFETLRDKRLGQRLKDQCDKILQRTTSDLMLVAITLAETKFTECHTKYERAINQMKKNQESEVFYEKFERKHLDIMNRRFRLLDERLMRFYNFKLDFFTKAPTDTN